ncbi:MAG TPA: DUF72 domain-containing protein [Gemmatimonadaceae bacterium]|nr:DUF72 domain-containing protein [Gemmatimonadaceae bacterium]
MTPYRIGCAGWAIPKAHKSEFPAEGSHLQRYAARFPAVEINSSFYQPHRPATWSRWAQSVPHDFRFSAKVPKTITHKHRLSATAVLLDTFLAEVTCLGSKLGCLLVQLPPSLAYDAPIVESFFEDFRARYQGSVVVEPRHASWFTPDIAARLSALRIGQVAADPAVVPDAAEPAGWPEIVYVRLHGSPEIYYSNYDEAYLDRLAGRMREYAARAREVWCIFDNTARFAATPNALSLLGRLSVTPVG